MIITILKTVGLRLASWSLAAWLSPVGKLLIVAAVVGGGYWYWESHTRAKGAAEEAAKWAENKRLGIELALEERTAIMRVREEQERRDDAEEAARLEAEKQVRDDNPGDDILWRADDGWLQSKRRRRSQPGS